jgi:4-amino-4-deoxy-L-arabinose transferase-like glycosyltransferase
LAAAALLLLFRLGATDLWAPDEPRYAQVAEELRSLERGAEDLFLLRLNGKPYTQKPPLYYWLAAALGAPGGRVSETVARLPSALAGIAAVFATLRLGARMLGPSAGIWGALLLLSVYRFGHLARRVQLDVLLAALEVVALLAFWRLDRGLGGRRANAALLHGALGLAVLTCPIFAAPFQPGRGCSRWGPAWPGSPAPCPWRRRASSATRCSKTSWDASSPAPPTPARSTTSWSSSHWSSCPGRCSGRWYG